MEAAEWKYDEFFMDILQDKKSIVGFLQTVFSFLARRTDFYHEAKSEADGLGFPPGVKEKLVKEVMLQFGPERIAAVNRLRQQQKDSRKCQIAPEIPPVANEVEIIASSDEERLAKSDASIPANSSVEPTLKLASQIREAGPCFQKVEYYNGACYDNYCWSQTIAEVEVHVLLPKHISTSKQLQVKIDPDHIAVNDKGKPEELIFGGKISMKCRSNEVVWSISNRKLQITLGKGSNTGRIFINLCVVGQLYQACFPKIISTRGGVYKISYPISDKVAEAWWDRFLETEAKLDLSTMDCSRPLEELSEESQAVIEKLRWDEQQKVLGIPTSEDIKNHELLKQAWDAEGSPFKGQPFDPSIVKFN